MNEPYIKWKDRSKIIKKDFYGYEYHTFNQTDGGVLSEHKGMLDAVKKLKPDTQWEYGMDFGCGDGGVGLMFQGSHLVKDFVYVDHFSKAVENCKNNLKRNHLNSKVIFEGDIKEIKCDPVDFVFTNPPHFKTCTLKEMYDLNWLDRGGIKKFKESSYKILKHIPHRHFDMLWVMHKIFYMEITRWLRPKADLFVYENGEQTSPIIWEWGQIAPGLNLEGWVDGTEVKSLGKYYVIHLTFDRHIANKQIRLPEGFQMPRMLF